VGVHEDPDHRDGDADEADECGTADPLERLEHPVERHDNADGNDRDTGMWCFSIARSSDNG
jgi:hypothetical protein